LSRATRPRFVLYTVALPPYRHDCMAILADRLGTDWAAFAGNRLLNAAAWTRNDTPGYRPVSNWRLLGNRLLFQWGHWGDAIRADVAILDLNPRSITAWLLLGVRRLLRRRTLLWGHLHPRRGAGSPTASLRRFMRRQADGCLLYSYIEALDVDRESPTERAWVAPNALYGRSELGLAGREERNTVVYSGRLDRDKNPGLLLEAFGRLASTDSALSLCFVGDGALEPDLRRRANQLGLTERVAFLGTIEEPEQLRELYSTARCAVSPGYCGLSLTQTLGFGVPMVVADNERHAPEIELASLGYVQFFSANSESDLAARIAGCVRPPDSARAALVSFMKENYSAEAMAEGVFNALVGGQRRRVLLAPLSYRPSTASAGLDDPPKPKEAFGPQNEARAHLGGKTGSVDGHDQGPGRFNLSADIEARH
jgi:glycosyltransferase involved in cell wall biosynthesis